MKIFQRLRDLSTLLRQYDGCFAVCGGVAASIYRVAPRFTGDIDVCLVDYQSQSARQVATAIIEAMGYRPVIGFVCQQSGPLREEPALVVGREDEAKGFVGIDFLLPVLPWIPRAVQRAQANKLDYGFCRLATVTREDLLLAKLFALSAEPSRLNDLDDIQDITGQAVELDLIYLKEQISQLKLQIPEAAGSLGRLIGKDF